MHQSSGIQHQYGAYSDILATDFFPQEESLDFGSRLVDFFHVIKFFGTLALISLGKVVRALSSYYRMVDGARPSHTLM